MRKFVIPAAIIGLLAGTNFALAQDHDRGRGGEQHGGGPAMSGPREHRDAPAMRANDNNRRDNNQPRENNMMRGPAPNNAMRGPAPNNAMRGPQPNNNAMRGPNGRPDFNRPGDNRPNNAMRGPRRDYSNYRNYHRNFRAPRRFRAPVYRRPPGWYAHTWTWGQILPVAFWSRDYWITDFNIYDLPPPPFGAIWVRVGSDALLIDQDSGEIIEVDYGIFY